MTSIAPDLQTSVPPGGDAGGTDSPRPFDGATAAWPRGVALAVAAATAAQAAALGPLLRDHVSRLLAAEHYGFAPWLFAAAALFAAVRVRQSLPLVPGRRGRAIAAWGGVALLTAAAILVQSAWAAGVCVLAAVPAAAYSLGGGRLVRTLAPVGAYLLLALRPPLGLDEALIVRLQAEASAWASGLLDLAGVRHQLAGVVIRTADRDFLVEEACSGVHSLFSSLAVLGGFALATRRGLGRSAVLLAAGVFWVFYLNVLRVAAVVYLSVRHDLPVASGFGHEAIGVLLFAGVLGLAWSVERGYVFLFPHGFRAAARALTARRREASPEAAYASYYAHEDEAVYESSAADRAEATPGGAAPPDGPAALSGRPRRRWEVALIPAAFVALAALRVTTLPAGPGPLTAPGQAKGAAVDAGVLPEEWDGWRLTKTELRRGKPDDANGVLSRIWFYRKGDADAAFSVDGPFAEWHDLRHCYRNTGWTVEATSWSGDRKRPAGGPPAGPPGGAAVDANVARLGLRKGADEFGLVYFAAYDALDRPVAPRTMPWLNRLRFLTAAANVGGATAEGPGAPGDPVRPVYQTQLFHADFLPPDRARTAELKRLFDHLRGLVAANPPAADGGRVASRERTPLKETP